ncbi:hypothetical protein B0H14DRAFT_2654794 [Mycena olivaceomarginata]|nr:hypothetical protein B0H14DRAFT_2654794 [Mycena olivaceomarginata]
MQRFLSTVKYSVTTVKWYSIRSSGWRQGRGDGAVDDPPAGRGSRGGGGRGDGGEEDGGGSGGRTTTLALGDSLIQIHTPLISRKHMDSCYGFSPVVSHLAKKPRSPPRPQTRIQTSAQDNTRYFENQLQAALAKINGLEADHKRLLNVQKQKNMEIQGLTAENEGFKGQLEIQRVELAKVQGIFIKRTHHSLTDDKASSGIKELETISADFCSREDQKEFQLETVDFTKKSVEQQTQLQRAYYTIKALEAKCENLLIQQGGQNCGCRDRNSNG